MKPYLQGFLRVVVSVSLLLLVLVATNAQETKEKKQERGRWVDVQTYFRSAKDEAKAVEYLEKEYGSYDESNLSVLIDEYSKAKTSKGKHEAYQDIDDYLESLAIQERLSPSTETSNHIKKIKSKTQYNLKKEAKSSTWIGETLRRLSGQEGPGPIPKVNAPSGLGVFLQGVLYVLLGLAILGVIYLISRIPFSKLRNRAKAKSGLLEEGEELLTEDEYLAKAEALIAQGNYREACRALYLASLLRIDSLNIARFEPTQTNWEHYRRIVSSKKWPEDLDFRRVTRAFDDAWYGYLAKSATDVQVFIDMYLQLKLLKEQAA